MPTKYRLSRSDFARMRGFKRVNGTLFSLSYGILPNRPSPGAACVVSAKTASKAVTRNQIKRRSRTTLLSIVRTLPDTFVIVLHAKKAAATASAKEIDREIRSLLPKTRSIS